MPTNSALARPVADVDEAMAIGDVAFVLGIPEVAVHALVDKGLFGLAVGDEGFVRPVVDDLAERIWRAALPTGSSVQGVSLADAVEAFGAGNVIWPIVIAALLDGRLNAFRRRGACAGPSSRR